MAKHLFLLFQVCLQKWHLILVNPTVFVMNALSSEFYNIGCQIFPQFPRGKCDVILTIILWHIGFNMVLFFAFVLPLGKAAVLTLQDVGSTRSISHLSCSTVNSDTSLTECPQFSFACVVGKQSGSLRGSATVWASLGFLTWYSCRGMCPTSTCTHQLGLELFELWRWRMCMFSHPEHC